MDKNESEQIIRQTIEYANQEIQKNKRRSIFLIAAVLLGVLVLLLSYPMLFHYEVPIAYQAGLVDVKVPEDGGIDIQLNLENYEKARAVLVKTGDSSYDLYIGIMETAATKLIPDSDSSDNFLRVGNGMIVDFQSGQLLGHLPNGNNEQAIQNIYYLDALTEKAATMTDQQLIDYEEKTLVWKRGA